MLSLQVFGICIGIVQLCFGFSVVLNYSTKLEKDGSLLLGEGGRSLHDFFFSLKTFIFIGIHLFCLIIGGFLDCCQIRNGLFVTMFWRLISDSFVLRFCLLKGYLYCCN